MMPLTRRHLAPWILTALAISLTGCPEKEGANLNPTLELNPSSSELSYVVGDAVTITVLARDDDGDALTFDYESRTENELSTLSTAQWFPTPTMATFTWTPDSADVTGESPLELIFVVKDARGGYVDRKVAVNIVPGNGSPQFESSANELYKNCCEKALRVPVKVRDDDSTEVSITMKNAPTGAQFTKVDGKSGEFTWKPNETQAEQRVHGVTFVADDGQNPAVEQKVTIIIPPKNLGGSGVDPTDPNADLCVGEAAIKHTSLGPQRGVAPEFSVNATLTPMVAQRYDQYIIFWSQYDPIANPETLVYSEEMTLDTSSNVISGAIPNQALREEADQTIYYKICLIDTQAAEDDPTSLICSPTATDFYYSFNLYLDPQATCKDDALDETSAMNDDFDSAQEVSKSKWDAYKLCSSSPDYHSVRVRPGATVKALVSYPQGSDFELKVFDSAQQEVTAGIEKSDCTGLTTIELKADGSSAGETYYVRVEGDEISYHMRSVEVEGGAGCKDEANEPNDSPSMATALPTDGTVLTTPELCPTGEDIDIYAFDLQAGEKIDINMTFATANSNLMDMTLFSPSERDAVSPSSTGSAFTFAFNTTDEPLSFEARQCGTHYLLVFSADGLGVAPYTLDATKSVSSCMDDDMFAGMCNHSQDAAAFFSWNQSIDGLKLCPKGQDWLKHRGGAAEILAEVKVTQGSRDDVQLELYDAQGAELASATRDGDDALSLSYTFADDELYYFRVVSSGSEPVSYDLFVID